MRCCEFRLESDRRIGVLERFGWKSQALQRRRPIGVMLRNTGFQCNDLVDDRKKVGVATFSRKAFRQNKEGITITAVPEEDAFGRGVSLLGVTLHHQGGG